MTTVATRRHPPHPRRIVVELRGALGLVGTLVKYLSAAVLFPVVLALGYREPVWPFLAAGAIMAAVGLALERLGRNAPPIGFREGFFVVSITWLAAAALGAVPYLLSGDPQIDRPCQGSRRPAPRS